MSGGGADGAFAAGLLNGWTQSGKRPEFTVVTGVSIGALLAPYAFLGSKFDEELRSAITTITGADIFEDRPTHESFLDTWPLRRLLEKRVTPELVAGVAAEHRKGRRLLVVTTNVDAGRRVIWDMGAIAQKGDEAAIKLFRDVLLASSAIPGFFTPVLIEVEANGKKFQEMHIDGSVTAPFFVAPEAVLEPGSKLRLPATELYIVLNGAAGARFLSAGAHDGRDPEPADQRRAEGRPARGGDAVRRQCAAAGRADACRAGGRQLQPPGLWTVRREIHERALRARRRTRENGTAFETIGPRAGAAHRQSLI